MVSSGPVRPFEGRDLTHVLGNPVKYQDPSGHCAQGDGGCWYWVDILWQQYGWSVDLDGVTWTAEELIKIWNAGTAVGKWFETNGGGDSAGRMRAVFGGTYFSHVSKSLAAKFFAELNNRNHVVGKTVYLLDTFSVNAVIHELGHVLDNSLANIQYPGGASVFGGGPGDDMARAVGLDPTECFFRFQCDWEQIALSSGAEINPLAYGRKFGPSEDFADSFKLSVLGGLGGAPIREKFMQDLAVSQVQTRSEYPGKFSAYLQSPIIPVPAPAPPR
jgi:hypothetical protein